MRKTFLICFLYGILSFIESFNISEYLPLTKYGLPNILNRYNGSYDCISYGGVNFKAPTCIYTGQCQAEPLENLLTKKVSVKTKDFSSINYKVNYYFPPKKFLMIDKCNVFPYKNDTFKHSEIIVNQCENYENLAFKIDYYIHTIDFEFEKFGGIFYANKYCAICNNVKHYFSIDLTFMCDKLNDTKYLLYTNGTLEQMVKWANANCHRYFHSNWTRIANETTNYFSSTNIAKSLIYYSDHFNSSLYSNGINITSEKELLKFLCDSYQYTNFKNVKNEFCALYTNKSIETCELFSPIELIYFSNRKVIPPYILDPITAIYIIDDNLSYFKHRKAISHYELKFIEYFCNGTNLITFDVTDPTSYFCSTGECTNVNSSMIYHPLFEKCVSRLKLLKIEIEFGTYNNHSDNWSLKAFEEYINNLQIHTQFDFKIYWDLQSTFASYVGFFGLRKYIVKADPTSLLYEKLDKNLKTTLYVLTDKTNLTMDYIADSVMINESFRLIQFGTIFTNVQKYSVSYEKLLDTNKFMSVRHSIKMDFNYTNIVKIHNQTKLSNETFNENCQTYSYRIFTKYKIDDYDKVRLVRFNSTRNGSSYQSDNDFVYTRICVKNAIFDSPVFPNLPVKSQSVHLDAGLLIRVVLVLVCYLKTIFY